MVSRHVGEVAPFAWLRHMFVFDTPSVQLQQVQSEIHHTLMYYLNTHKREDYVMPRIPVGTNDRVSLRIASDEKLLLMRAATLQHTNLTEFVIRNIVSVAQKIIDENERLALTERDSLRTLELLDNPPVPNNKLMAAAFALPKRT